MYVYRQVSLYRGIPLCEWRLRSGSAVLADYHVHGNTNTRTNMNTKTKVAAITVNYVVPQMLLSFHVNFSSYFHC
jgi:hypothetical protein